MLVSRPLSVYRKSPSSVSIPPSDSGYFVMKDEEAQAQDSYCWGICRRKTIKTTPFPQDRLLTIIHSSSPETNSITVWMLPVLHLPLSSNRYYIIKAKGKYKGKAYRCARENDITTCCFGDVLSDRNPKPLNLRDIYQQFQIQRHHNGGFFAQSVAPDGVPPKFLRTKGWKLRSSSTLPLPHHRLTAPLGLDSAARSLLPDFNFPIFTARSPATLVGKWYCPFVFVTEKSLRPRDQMKRSPVYSLTLEQCWEEIFSCDNAESESSSIVTVAIDVAREVVLVAGREAVVEESRNGLVWFRVSERFEGRKVGLSLAVVERMRWVQEAGGWFGGGGERVVRVEKVEEITSDNGWRRFSLYMLVESFVLRRMNGDMVWKCNFRHTHNIRCKWE